MSRPKRMLPVVGQAPQEPEAKEPEAARVEADGCTDDCCSGAETVEASAAARRSPDRPRTWCSPTTTSPPSSKPSWRGAASGAISGARSGCS